MNTGSLLIIYWMEEIMNRWLDMVLCRVNKVLVKIEHHTFESSHRAGQCIHKCAHNTNDRLLNFVGLDFGGN